MVVAPEGLNSGRGAGSMGRRRGGSWGRLVPSAMGAGVSAEGRARGSALSELQVGFKAGGRCLICGGRTAQPRVLLPLVLHHCRVSRTTAEFRQENFPAEGSPAVRGLPL